MWLAARASPRLFRAAAYPLIALTVFFLVLVLAVGETVLGATRELSVAGLPSSRRSSPSWPSCCGAPTCWPARRSSASSPSGGSCWSRCCRAAILALLVMLGNDLGTTLILLVIFLALLWVIGSPGRLFIGMLALMAFIVLILILVAPYRLDRFTGFLDPQADPLGAGLQELKGMNALGSGGPFGVGLGASRSKWGWVPESSTDFIFAILGEELGLVGTLSWSCCTAGSPTPGCGSPGGCRTRSCGWPRPRSRCGSWPRRW